MCDCAHDVCCASTCAVSYSTYCFAADSVGTRVAEPLRTIAHLACSAVIVSTADANLLSSLGMQSQLAADVRTALGSRVPLRTLGQAAHTRAPAWTVCACM